MFGFIVGTLCLIGLVRVVSGGHRSHWGHRGGCGHHHHGRGGRKGRGRIGPNGFWRAGAEVLKRRLDLDEDQGDIVDHALRDLRDSTKEFKEVLKDSRDDVADAFRGDKVDDATLAAVFARQDEELASTRRGVVSALKQIHSVLDDEQRQKAADWLGSGEPGFGRKGWSA